MAASSAIATSGVRHTTVSLSAASSARGGGPRPAVSIAAVSLAAASVATGSMSTARTAYAGGASLYAVGIPPAGGALEEYLWTTITKRFTESFEEVTQQPTDKCLLEDKQKLLGLKNDNLINDCVTRWNSTYDMICRASEQQAAVAAVIFEKKLSHLELTTNEWMVVENIRETLKPFKTATAALSTDKYPTASAVLPLQHILINQVKNFAASEIPVIKEMKNKIYSDLSLRYDKEERQSTFMLLNKMSFFDPRFHRLIHLSEQEKRQVQEEIQTEVRQRSENCEIQLMQEMAC
ncbi:UNVERIFIED_CONTAM: hypothetical protein FKN15_061001 [Acipenser sinensis]